MKTIGLVGGMSWESSAHYYRIINQAVQARLGGVHSARCLLYSLDFGDIAAKQHAGDWDALTADMIDAAQRLEQGGADVVLICTNTMHLMADAVAAGIRVPLLHIADATGARIRADGLEKVALIGTAFTMEQPFYTARLAERFGLEVIVPEADDRRTVHAIIYDELVKGVVNPASRVAYREVMAQLAARGAQAIILGCTEIMLLVEKGDASVPLYDTTTLHAMAAVEMALAVDSPKELRL
ncbi:aspartate/glutamate racemase family protein [Sphingobium algorifonticola]|uniref:Aspartate/glutamate racemase family protein n=1 Tax=Sphingobium algorifonticola TaxID=2008318 RepID=A0A437JCD3_9SPHN|nr:aspartate/glutamate racemase family protein [Sphingobium algorifonticola]RVT43413.1 aspartate/glutamate racemase family protein [Sphingobium algorifonticola]